MIAQTESFGQLLARYRNLAGLTQRQLASSKHDLSYSFIAMLERGGRGTREVILRREQVWYLMTRLELWPPDCDNLLRAAGHTTDRTAKEELDIQKGYSFRELWVFARTILDPDAQWYGVVKENIVKKNVVYRYFTETPTTFNTLLARLKHDKVSSKIVASNLECVILPRELFITNFAIYKPEGHQIYCCGGKTVLGKGEMFYTMDNSATTRLYEQLQDWRGIINLGHTIPLLAAKRIYPKPEHRAPFSS